MKKQYLFTVQSAGVNPNGNVLIHVYAAWKLEDEQGWRNFSPDELKELNLGRVIKGKYITTSMYANEFTEALLDKYGNSCSFMYLF